MGQSGTIAPPPPQDLAWAVPQGVPYLDRTATVHPFAQVLGTVIVGPRGFVAPGVLVRGDGEARCVLGQGVLILEGASLQGSGEGRVLGDDQQPHSLWIGAGVAIAPKAVIQGPAYVGANSFIGCRSTVFNARLNAGVVVMMHALVQDVEIPPGKLVPAGAVITQQVQADALPMARDRDRALARELLGPDAPRWLTDGPPGHGAIPPSSSPHARSPSPGFAGATRFETGLNTGSDTGSDTGSTTMQSQKLTADLVHHVRQLLHQGYRIGTEHADTRRFRSNVWQTCTPITATQEGAVLAALEACLEEHAGEYVRLFGVDPVAKQRVSPITIQRPDGTAIAMGSHRIATPGASNSSSRPAAPSGVGLSAEVAQQVRGWLAQGYRIGTEHADTRRFRSNVWQTCAPIEASQEGAVLAALGACLQEHAGEYVRIFGIDPKAKQRTASVTVQRPGESVPVTGSYATTNGNGGGHYTPAAVSGLAPEVAQQIRGWLAQGCRIGAEHADTRRFRSNVWQTCAPIEATHEQGAIAAIAACIQSHPNEYVRIYGIDAKAKQRLNPITVQRPGEAPTVTATNGHRAGARVAAPAPTAPGGKAVDSGVAQQVQQLVGQGYRISVEYADVRRYRSGAWQSGGILEGRGPSEVMAALETSLRQYPGHYVRLIGFDPQAKRRVLETTIQRP